MSFEDLINWVRQQIESETTNLEFMDKLDRLQVEEEKEVVEDNKHKAKKDSMRKEGKGSHGGRDHPEQDRRFRRGRLAGLTCR